MSGSTRRKRAERVAIKRGAALSQLQSEIDQHLHAQRVPSYRALRRWRTYASEAMAQSPKAAAP